VSIARPGAGLEPIAGLPQDPAEAAAHLLRLLHRSTQ